MGINVTGLFLLAYLCDVLSVPLLNQVYRRSAPKVNVKIIQNLGGVWKHSF